MATDPQHDALAGSFYQRVPADQQRLLTAFRAAHPPRQIAHAGLDWSYLAGGRGDEALLLLAGGIANAETWWRLINRFEDRYRVIAPLYPPGLPDMATIVAALEAILAHENLLQVGVIGASFGGMIAGCFVRAYPDVVARLMLSNTCAPDPRWGRTVEWRRALLGALPDGATRALLRFNALRGLDAPPLHHELLRAQLTERLSHPDIVAEVVGIQRSIADYCTHYQFTPGDLAHWGGKLLIVESADDPIFNAQQRSALRALYPGARVHTVLTAGHTPAYSRPEEYAAVIEGFLARHA